MLNENDTSKVQISALKETINSHVVSPVSNTKMIKDIVEAIDLQMTAMEKIVDVVEALGLKVETLGLKLKTHVLLKTSTF